MYEISNRTAFPYSAITYISVTFADGYRARGSGVVVGVNDVLTAMHVIYEAAHGGWATSISIMPGADTSPYLIAPFGTYTDWGRVNSRTTNWDTNGDGLLTDAEAQWDIAVIGMRSRIGDQTGYLGLSGQSTDSYATMFGYPGRGTGMMAETVYADASSFFGVFDINSGLGAGASGGPLVNSSNQVLGVLSSGDANDATSNYAALFGNGTWDWLLGVLAANDDLFGGGTIAFTGTGGNDQLTGNSLNNIITGLAGNDRIEGGAGNDALDGGSGIDVAVYSGLGSEYTVSFFGSTATITDRTSGRDGVDTLGNVERLNFLNVNVALDIDGNAGQAYRLYQAAFNRTPDPGGVGYQMAALDNGLSLSQVANNFILSPEFSAKYGTLNNTQFVTQLYTNVLHRTPDAGGLAFYVNNLAAGMARASVLVGFSESPENQAALIGVIQNGITYTV